MGTNPPTAYTRAVEFLLNGKKIHIENPEPSLLLADYLRSPEVALTGTKVACGEGGCGACTVVIARREAADQDTTEIVEWAINSCLRPVCTLDGTAVTTVEGLGGTSEALHPIQEQVVTCDATQCGFCTPGFVMNMYGLLRREASPLPQTIEDRFDGNLCRCTGYRSILDAMHAFDKASSATDADYPDPNDDTDDLDTGERHVSAAKRSTAARRTFKDADLPTEQSIRIGGDGQREYVRPLLLDDALTVLKDNWAAGTPVTVTAGGTSIGVYPDQLAGPEALLDVSHVQELRTVALEPAGSNLTKATHLHIGGSVTFAHLLDELAVLTASSTAAAARAHARALSALAEMVARIASQQVRSMATVGGTLMLVRSHVPPGTGEPFPSDFCTAAAALGATVQVRTPTQPDADTEIPLFDVLAAGTFLDALPVDALIVGVRIPLTSATTRTRMYKVARRDQCAHALVNAGFAVQLADVGGTKQVTAARLVFGGIQRAPRIASATAAVLVGQPWTAATFETVGAVLHAEILDGIDETFDAGASGAYRAAVAVGLLRKFFIEVAKEASIADAGFGDNQQSAASPAPRRISEGTAGTVEIEYRGFAAIPGWLAPDQPLGDATAAAVVAIDGVTVVKTPARSAALAPAATTVAANGAGASSTTTAVLVETDTVKADEDVTVPAAAVSVPATNGSNGTADHTEATAPTPAPAKPKVSHAQRKLPPPKISAAIQATGEAHYTVDEYGPPGTLHGVNVYSMARHARFGYRLDVIAPTVPVVPVEPVAPDDSTDPVDDGDTDATADPIVAGGEDAPADGDEAAEASGVAVAVEAPPVATLDPIDRVAEADDKFMLDEPPEHIDITSNEASPYDVLAALKAQLQERFPAYRGYITAYDIPRHSDSDVYNGSASDSYDPTFAAGRVTSHGQPIGVVVADTVADAKAIATAIQGAIEYFEVLPAVRPEDITTIAEARHAVKPVLRRADESITRPGSDPAWLLDHVKGEVPPDITTDARLTVTGHQRTAAAAHFYMEPQIALAIPTEDGTMTLYCESQSLQSCQSSIAWALKMQHHDIRVKLRRLGGSYGGKERRSVGIALAAAVAAHTLKKPVRLALDRHTDMAMVGKQHPFIGEYWAVVERASGKIENLRIDMAADTGCSRDVGAAVLELALLSADGAYEVPTFQVNGLLYQTHVEPRVAFRSFGVMQSTLILEEAVERIACALGKRPDQVREASFYPDRVDNRLHRTHFGQELRDAKVRQVWDTLKHQSDFDQRLVDVADFNGKNRWRKRGISMIPIKYGIGYTHREFNQATAQIAVYRDGTVLVHHGGVEMGQGLDTKVKRIAARALGISDEMVRVASTDTGVIPNASTTGSSTGTDLVGAAVLDAARNLRARLERIWKPDSAARLSDAATAWASAWKGVVKDAYDLREPLSSTGYSRPPVNIRTKGTGQLKDHEQLFYYYTYGAAATEVEIDVLTGESIIRQADLLYDAGQSVDPFIDVGQIEGSFIQGIGTLTSEHTRYADDGRLITNGTWEYKPPFSKSIPEVFNVHLLRYPDDDAANGPPLDRFGVLSSKATGEPPLVLATSAFFAIKHAILAARMDHANDAAWFDLDAPATTERIRQACIGITPG